MNTELQHIQDFIQAFVNAIAAILNVEVTVVDRNMFRVAATSKHHQINQKIRHASFYQKVLLTKKPTEPYRSIPMDLEKVNSLHSKKLFEQIVRGEDNTLLDREAVNRAIFLGIKPDSHYYHPIPIPMWAYERYKNYPHQKGISLAQAEYQHPLDEYVDLIKFEVGDNYQYKTIIKEKWYQQPISLQIESFNTLENGSHFFKQDSKGTLIPLSDVEEAISQPSYIRVEKTMGKIVSILKKTGLQKISYLYAYDNNNQMHHVTFKVINSQFFDPLTIETTYDDKGVYITQQTISNDKPQLISSFVEKDNNNIYGIVERFNHNGIKTNHIILLSNTNTENRYLDSAGHILFTTDEIQDRENPQPYYDDAPSI